MFKKIFLTLAVLLITNFNISYAEIIKNFKISGNDRISDKTIILFSGYSINDDIDQNKLNQIIKELYDTSFFEKISINFDNGILYIDVKENPLIQSIGP